MIFKILTDWYNIRIDNLRVMRKTTDNIPPKARSTKACVHPNFLRYFYEYSTIYRFLVSEEFTVYSFLVKKHLLIGTAPRGAPDFEQVKLLSNCSSARVARKTG